MKRQIAHILSTNYAGSHFLTLQLGSHSQCASIGEFHRFKPNSSGRIKQSCRRCDDDELCPVFKGLRDVSVSELYSKVFSNLKEEFPGVHTAIDNSKKTRWSKQFLDLEGIDQKYIHIIRDPRALIRRWMMRYDSEHEKNKIRQSMMRRCWRQAWNIKQGNEANVYLWKWHYQNKLITDFIQQNSLDARVITYHDLVHDPDEILSGLMNWLGLSYEPGQPSYWNFDHHGSMKPQYMRPPEDGHRIHDQRWKPFLDEETQIQALSHETINQYLSDLNLQLCEEGGLIGDLRRSSQSNAA